MSVSVDYAAKCTIRETLVTNVPAASASKKVVTHDLFNSAITLPSNNPAIPATKGVAVELNLTAGAATLDLTAVPGTGGGTEDLTGLKIQVMKIKAKAANANPITIEVGASDGYDLAGSAFSVTLAPGQEILFFGNEATPDVGSGDKELDLSGTGTQGVEIAIVAG